MKRPTWAGGVRLAKGELARVRDAIFDHWLGYLIAILLTGGVATAVTTKVVEVEPSLPACIEYEDLEELELRLLYLESSFSRLHISEVDGIELCFTIPDAKITSGK